MTDMTDMTNMMPPAEPGMEAEEEQTAEMVICIEAYSDGTYKVGIENEGEEAPEGEEDAGMKQVGSIAEALKVAKALLEQQPMTAEGDAPFMAGYKSARGGYEPE